MHDMYSNDVETAAYLAQELGDYPEPDRPSAEELEADAREIAAARREYHGRNGGVR